MFRKIKLFQFWDYLFILFFIFCCVFLEWRHNTITMKSSFESRHAWKPCCVLPPALTGTLPCRSEPRGRPTPSRHLLPDTHYPSPLHFAGRQGSWLKLKISCVPLRAVRWGRAHSVKWRRKTDTLVFFPGKKISRNTSLQNQRDLLKSDWSHACKTDSWIKGQGSCASHRISHFLEHSCTDATQTETCRQMSSHPDKAALLVIFLTYGPNRRKKNPTFLLP